MANTVSQDVHGPLTLVCFSMGAMVGLEILRLESARVRGLAFISADLRPDSPARTLTRSKLANELSEFGVEATFGRTLRDKYFPKASHSMTAERVVADMAATAGLDVFLRQLRALHDRADPTDLLHTISCPTLSLSSADDTLCPIEAEDFIKGRINHATCVRLDAGGHFLPLTEPARVRAALSDWMTKEML